MSAGIKITLSVLLIIAAVCLGPMLFLWAINTLAELGGATFYINHSVWSYFVSIILIAIVRGSS